MLNVDAWLDTIEPWQFDEWVAFRRIEPDPDQWLRSILKLGFAGVCAVCGFGAQIDPEDFDPCSKKLEPIDVTPAQAFAMAKAAIAAR